ncbi:MAG: DUF1080 domain-containing protein [Isosphaera sp.]|nr:DUF1080 domain-containing protein [Isosphaera sp.]
MPRLLAACALLALALPALADDKPKPNTLTPKEIADGWVLLFDGETTFGWKEAKEGKKAELAAKDGALVIAGKGVGVQFTTRFRYAELTGEYRTATKGSSLDVTLESPGVGLGAGDGLLPSEKDEWRRLIVRLTPRETLVAAGEPGKSGLSGPAFGQDIVATVGFKLPDGEDGRIELRNLKLRPLEAKPLFAGKNLDGWKVNQADPKRVASKFEVTKAGELSVKNGPGDLVSEAEFANFVLQFECKTLGDGLNSGVFFRCIPGQYQNGYEAQVQNAFLDKDRTKPKDFGTGAIYRRVPARKVVSDDNEWFTMTVVADGRHIATWVNGYQTVDWTDDRKENENPRQGYRAAKGPISIQGHDPTTDLLFRNIRIAELPGEKK